MSERRRTPLEAPPLRRRNGRVYQMYTDFQRLECLYPGFYPRYIVRGQGPYLYDEDDLELIDGSQHLGACPIGHGRHEMAQAIAEQASTLEYCSLDGGVAHKLVYELAGQLSRIIPSEEPLFFFCSSGSEANEIAIKVARLFHAATGASTRKKILARSGSYHGSSFGAMSMNGDPALRELFAPLLPGVIRVAEPAPGSCGYCTICSGCSLECAADIERAILREGAETVAAVFAEPISMYGSIKIPHPGYWPRVREICDRYDVLLILDEVVTGFGRTGRMFGSEHWELRGDILTMAKGITSSYVPMGAVAVAGRLADVLESYPLTVHSNTHSGHPLACIAALTNLGILKSEDLPGQAARLESAVRERQRELQNTHESISRTSVIGLLSSVEFVLDRGDGRDVITHLKKECYDRGLLIRGSSTTKAGAVIVYPPLVVTDEVVSRTFEVLHLALAAVGIP